ncbi:hypothetical protein D3C75_1266690 [compost metagenome]
MTEASSPFFASSLAKAQGAVSSIYLLVRLTRLPIAVKATENSIFSRASSALVTALAAASFSALSKGV